MSHLNNTKKSERHHWWPECVSKRWADSAGGVNWVLPDSTERRAKPSSFGVIGNGHIIKLDYDSVGETAWDENFEAVFRKADDRFPAVIDWLESLEYLARPGVSRRMRFVPQPSSNKMFGELVESVVSLCVRSPMTRNCAVSIAERLRGSLPERERNSLIGLNMRHMQRDYVRSLGVRGKATAIYSPEREFHFGDGFFHNMVTGMPPHSVRALVPLTPRLALLYAMPIQYSPYPRLSTLVINSEEADALNRAIQVYAREALFYRSDKPIIIEEYQRGTHLRYASSRNSIELLIHDMPGVPERNGSLDFLEDFVSRLHK